MISASEGSATGFADHNYDKGDLRMKRLTAALTDLTQKYLPDSFVLAILLALMIMVLAIALGHQNVFTVIDYWGSGFWSLLSFTMQVAMILLAGYALATAP